MWFGISLLIAISLEVFLIGASYLIPELPQPWPELFFWGGAGAFLATCVLAYIFRDYRLSVRERRRKWKPSKKCIKGLRKIRESVEAPAAIEIFAGDTQSHYLALSLQDAFRCAGWEAAYDKKKDWGESPLQIEGIKMYGYSDFIVGKVAAVLQRCGLPKIQKVVWSNEPKENWGHLNFNLRIESE